MWVNILFLYQNIDQSKKRPLNSENEGLPDKDTTLGCQLTIHTREV